MTDKPKTLSLAPREWNSLLASNADDLATFFKAQHMPTAELYQHVAAHLDRMKAILPGWLASVPSPDPANVHAQTDAPQTNGAAAPKKRRGRPSNAEVAARAVQ